VTLNIKRTAAQLGIERDPQAIVKHFAGGGQTKYRSRQNLPTSDGNRTH